MKYNDINQYDIAYHNGWLAGQAMQIAKKHIRNPYEPSSIQWYAFSAGYKETFHTKKAS